MSIIFTVESHGMRFYEKSKNLYESYGSVETPARGDFMNIAFILQKKNCNGPVPSVVWATREFKSVESSDFSEFSDKTNV